MTNRFVTFLFFRRFWGMLQQRQEAQADAAQHAQLPHQQRRVDAGLEEEGAGHNRPHRDQGDAKKPLEGFLKLTGKLEQKFKLS